MPILQFYTSIRLAEIPKDFASKSALILAKVLKDKPLEKLVVHLLTDQFIFLGSDPKGTEQSAYAVLRSIGCLSSDENRVTAEAMAKHVEQELNIKPENFILLFIDLEPEMGSQSGKIFSDLMAQK